MIGAGVNERHHPDPALVKVVKVCEVPSNRRSVLECERHGDLAALECASQLFGRRDERQNITALDDPEHLVDAAVGDFLCVAGFLVARRDEQSGEDEIEAAVSSRGTSNSPISLRTSTSAASRVRR